MKKYIYLLFIASALLSSCSKELELNPYNRLETSQAFNNEGDFTLAVKGMYYGIRVSGSYYNGSWNIVGDVMADNLTFNPSGRGTQTTFYKWQYVPSTNLGFFSGGYTMVRRANAILENVDRLPAGTFRDNAKGEALAIRAMTYFDMSRFFSKTYENATVADLTLPYVTTTDEKITPASEPLKGFYDKVLNDLNTALPLIATTNGVGRLNKAAVAGLLSRVNLYKGDWPATITAANTALGVTPNLPNITDFPKIWLDATENGVLFKVLNTSTDNVNTQGTNYYQVQSGQIKSEYVVEYNLFQLFVPSDIRTSTYIKTSALGAANTLYNNVIKYNGGTGKAAGVQDAKVLRTAEVILNRMEAEYRNNQISLAVADLVLLKSNRYNPYISTADLALTGTALLDEILKQRRLELAFEGDRFYDLKRRNLPVVRDGTKGELADGAGTPYVAPFLVLPAGDYRFQLPFPLTETNFNPNLKPSVGY